MTTFTIHTPESAPAGSQPILSGAQQSLGFVPNLFGVLAESPAALEAYTALSGLVDKSSFDATEAQVVLMTANVENDCRYCVAAHTAIAGMKKVPDDVIASLREGRPIADPKLQALSVFTKAVVTKRGWVTPEDLAAFQGAGYGQAAVLDVILAVSMKVLSNYTNHIVDTPLDDAFAPHAWDAPATA